MFLIVPKPRHTPPNTNSSNAITTSLAPIPSSRGPTRAVAACDRCRIRKVKCNGKEPCQRCLQSSNICVFSKPRDEVGLVSGAYVSMLKSQQRRLVVALRNMDSIIEGQPRPSTDHQHSSHDDFDLSGILEKYAPCSKFEAMKDSTPKKASTHRNTGPQKKRRFQQNKSLDEEILNWPGPASSGSAPALGLPDSHWPTCDYSYDHGDLWNQPQSTSEPPWIEAKNESENTFETWDSSPPGLGLDMSPTEFQKHEPNDVFGARIAGETSAFPSESQLQAAPSGSELTPYNMSFEQLYQLIDWDASWQSCSEHFPLPDQSSAIASGQSTMDWEQ